MAATAINTHLLFDPGEMTVPWETLGAAAIGGLMTLLGSGVTLYFQKKLQDGKFAHEQQKAREDWERQEERRKEERSFELKRQAYQNYLAVIAQSSRIPIKPMEFKATLVLLELNGSAEVSQLASEFALDIESCIAHGMQSTTQDEMLTASNRLTAAILSDFRSHIAT